MYPILKELFYLMINHSLRKDYIWNSIGVFAQNAISPILLIVITRVNGIFDSGIFSFAFSVAIIFWAFGMWGGRTYQVSDVTKEFTNRSYIMVRLMLAAVMIIGAVIFAIINHYDVVKSWIIIALVLFKAVESIADSLYGILQVNGRLYISGKSLLYKAVLGIGVFLVVETIWHSILIGCLGIIGVNLLVLFAYDVPSVIKQESIYFDVRQIGWHLQTAVEIIKRCSPIAVVIFLTMFSLNVPRYFIDMFHVDQVGPFGIIAMPITLLALVITFVLQPNIVQLSRKLDQGQLAVFDTIVTKLALIASGIGIVVLFITYLFGVPLLQLVFGINFEPYRLSLIIIVIGAIANVTVTVYINVLTIMRHFKAQFYILLVTNIVLVLVSAMLVKQYGILGGASLFAIVNFIQALLLISTYKFSLKREMYKNA